MNCFGVDLIVPGCVLRSPEMLVLPLLRVLYKCCLKSWQNLAILGQPNSISTWHISLFGTHLAPMPQQHPTLCRNGFCRTFSHLPIKTKQLKKRLQFNAAAWGTILLITEAGRGPHSSEVFVSVFRWQKRRRASGWRRVRELPVSLPNISHFIHF